MPRKRQDPADWAKTRRRIWERDGKRCMGPYCAHKPAGSLGLGDARIDHIVPGIHATNRDSNLRTLCGRCHALRDDNYHQGLISQALRDGLIPPDWRGLVW